MSERANSARDEDDGTAPVGSWLERGCMAMGCGFPVFVVLLFVVGIIVPVRSERARRDALPEIVEGMQDIVARMRTELVGHEARRVSARDITGFSKTRTEIRTRIDAIELDELELTIRWSYEISHDEWDRDEEPSRERRQRFELGFVRIDLNAVDPTSIDAGSHIDSMLSEMLASSEDPDFQSVTLRYGSGVGFVPARSREWGLTTRHFSSGRSVSLLEPAPRRYDGLRGNAVSVVPMTHADGLSMLDDAKKRAGWGACLVEITGIPVMATKDRPDAVEALRSGIRELADRVPLRMTTFDVLKRYWSR